VWNDNRWGSSSYRNRRSTKKKRGSYKISSNVDQAAEEITKEVSHEDDFLTESLLVAAGMAVAYAGQNFAQGLVDVIDSAWPHE